MRYLTTTFIIALLATSCASGADLNNYAVVIDAGSSGTRVWVYKWEPVSHGLPNFDYLIKKRTNPGISETANNPLEMEAKLNLMLEQAAQVVPSHRQHSTPVYLLATAGMRYLLEDKAVEVIEQIDRLLQNTTTNPFYYVRSNIRILSGEEEGAFAWIAVNYMLGVFNSSNQDPSYKRTYGVIEMGGASTQIAFIPKGSLLAEHFPLKINGHRYSLYAHSYLHMGQDAVQGWILEQLVEDAQRKGLSNASISNPCFNKGVDFEVKGFKVQGDSNEGKHIMCSKLIERLVEKKSPRYCHPKPCGVGSVYQPSISPDQTFYGLSVYGLIFKELGLTTKTHTGPVNLIELYNNTVLYCERHFDDLKEGVEEERHKYLFKPCFMGLFLTRLLRQGYGFATDSESIYALEKVNGRNVDWTLGALIYETQSENTFYNCPSTAFSVGGTGNTFKPSFSIFFFALALPLYKLFPLPVATITR